MSNQVTIFFVLNGLLNGEDGVQAQRAGTGAQLPDGWYFLLDNGDTDGVGPFVSREEAQKAGQGSSAKAVEDKFSSWMERQLVDLAREIAGQVPDEIPSDRAYELAKLEFELALVDLKLGLDLA